MIQDLIITPYKDRGPLRARFRASLDIGIIVYGRILESKKGIYCTFRGIGFHKPEVKKELSNRVLATYVINYCIQDYNS